MTQQEFLSILKSELEKYGAQNTSEILSDYQEHFTMGLKNGKSEEEIAAKLGSPAAIAKAFETEDLINRVKSSSGQTQLMLALKVLGRLLVLAPFNFIIFFIPGVLVFALLVAGWSVTAGLGAVALSLFGAAIKTGIFALNFWLSLGFISGGLSLLGLTALGGMILYALTKYIFLGLIQYLQWNLNFVLEK